MNTFDLKAFVTALKDHPELLLRLQGVPDSLCMEAIAHGSSLEHIPLANRTRELCLAAVRRIGRNLDFVPEDMKDNQFYSDALAGTSGDYELFDRLPDSMKTRELCEKAVIEWGSSIKDVPERVRDKEFYAAVIAKGRFKLDEVPPEFLTEDDVLSCLKGTDTAYGFSSLPDRLKTQATCLAAAQKFWGFDLSDVPDHLRTPEIFALSIINDNCDVPIPEDMPFPWRLSDKGGVPDAPKSMIAFYNAMLDDPTLLWRVKGVPEQQLIEALWEHDESLRFVPVSLRTPEFARKIMNVYPAMYDRLPKYMQTAELQAYVEALEKKHNGVTRTWINLRELPEEQRTPELCMKAVKAAGLQISAVPKDLLTEELCLAAVKAEPEAINFVPTEFMTPEISFTSAFGCGWGALNSGVMPESIPFAPHEISAPSQVFTQPETMREFATLFADNPAVLGRMAKATDAIWEAMLQDSPWAIRYMADYLALEAVKQKPAHFIHLPDRLKTPEICAAGVKAYGSLLGYVPAGMRTYAMCMDAVKYHGDYLRDVPVELRDYPLCLEAAKLTHEITWTDFVPREHWDEAMAATGVASGVYSLKFLPDELKTESVCRAALLDPYTIGEFFGDIPVERRTAELVILSLMHGHRPEEIAPHVPEGVPLAPYLVE